MFKQILTLWFVLVVCQLNAQSYTFEGVKSASAGSTKTIMKGKDVVGYVVFYKRDKADRNNDNYGFDLLDEKLNKINSVKFPLPSNVILLHTVYNGQALGLMFYDSKKGNYIFKSFDSALQPLGTTFLDKLNKSELGLLSRMADYGSDGSYYYNIQAVPGKGFVRPGVGKSNSQYKLTFYDHAFKEKWTYETPEESKDYEFFSVSDVNEKYITGTTIRRSGALSTKMTYFLTVFEVETGKKIIDASIETAKQQLSLSSILLKEGSDEVLVQGEYYAEDDKPGVDKSKGIFIKTYNLSTQKEVSLKLLSWIKDIYKLFDTKSKASIEAKFLNFNHIIIPMPNGHYYMAFEQYKKVVDGGALVLNLASMGNVGGNITKLKIGNIWVMEMDATMTPINVKYFQKDESVVALPGSLEFMGAGYAGWLAKLTGQFDFQFYQKSEDGAFNIAYVNYDREKGEKTKTVVGNIFMPKEGAISFDKIDITAPKQTAFYLYPAQPGYVMLAQFMRKEEKLDFKLVKLNY
jgi:hypothetical protein